MNKQDAIENTVVRPLARELARELTQDELAMVAGGDGGNSGSCGGAGGDCTTDGHGGVQDADRLK